MLKTLARQIPQIDRLVAQRDALLLEVADLKRAATPHQVQEEADAVILNRARCRDAHNGCPYYDSAERDSSVKVFWGTDSVFLKLFGELDLETIAELACGHGRHSARIVSRAGSIALLDINESNIAYCRRRFSGNPNVSFHVNRGNDIPLPTGSCSSLFCYDAMVHFESMDVIAYLLESWRVLRQGGRALLHYSVNDAYPEGTFTDHPGWRNYFSESLMRHFATRTGFRILDRHVFSWLPDSDNPVSDGVVLLEKP